MQGIWLLYSSMPHEKIESIYGWHRGDDKANGEGEQGLDEEIHHLGLSPSDEDHMVAFIRGTSYDPYSPDSTSLMVVRCVLTQ